MTTAWSHLPNADHIDRILASVKAYSEVWQEARDSSKGIAACVAACVAAYDAAWDAAYDAARNATWDQSRDATWYAARNATWDQSRDAAYDAARDAISALIAWDDSSKWLNMPSDKLKVWYTLSEDPACILLLPAVVAFERIKELEVA